MGCVSPKLLQVHGFANEELDGFAHVGLREELAEDLVAELGRANLPSEDLRENEAGGSVCPYVELVFKASNRSCARIIANLLDDLVDKLGILEQPHSSDVDQLRRFLQQREALDIHDADKARGNAQRTNSRLLNGSRNLQRNPPPLARSPEGRPAVSPLRVDRSRRGEQRRRAFLAVAMATEDGGGPKGESLESAVSAPAPSTWLDRYTVRVGLPPSLQKELDTSFIKRAATRQATGDGQADESARASNRWAGVGVAVFVLGSLGMAVSAYYRSFNVRRVTRTMEEALREMQLREQGITVPLSRAQLQGKEAELAALRARWHELQARHRERHPLLYRDERT